MDSRATNLTRPGEMYLSQAMIAFAGALFLPPAMASGLMSALKKGPNYILSFVIVFLTTQSLGGLLGSAVFGTFMTMAREVPFQAARRSHRRSPTRSWPSACSQLAGRLWQSPRQTRRC